MGADEYVRHGQRTGQRTVNNSSKMPRLPRPWPIGEKAT
jgi:hypothetical protein